MQGPNKSVSVDCVPGMVGPRCRASQRHVALLTPCSFLRLISRAPCSPTHFAASFAGSYFPDLLLPRVLGSPDDLSQARGFKDHTNANNS